MTTNHRSTPRMIALVCALMVGLVTAVVLAGGARGEPTVAPSTSPPPPASPSDAPVALAAPGDPVVTLEEGTAGCNGVRTTPGSENTMKRLVSGNLEPGGTVTFEISYPVDPSDVAGRTTFVITDCVFIDGVAVQKYTVSFVPNTENYVLTFSLVIPEDTPIGAEFCNYAKTTAAPSESQASNRKAGPACFFVGGDLRIIKIAEGDETLTPLAGASFTVVCAPTTAFPPVVISGLVDANGDPVPTVNNSASGIANTGVIGIAGPEGTVCTITETAAPPGYDLPDPATFTFTIPRGDQGIEYIEDPLTPSPSPSPSVSPSESPSPSVSPSESPSPSPSPSVSPSESPSPSPSVSPPITDLPVTGLKVLLPMLGLSLLVFGIVLAIAARRRNIA